jgi:hypothetical protein
MKKIILISAVTLFSAGTYAAACDDSSLTGRFAYEVSGVNAFPTPVGVVTRSTHVVGQAKFESDGVFTITGYGSAAGVIETRTGTGDYTIDTNDCTASGTLTWNTGETSQFRIALSKIDKENGNKPYTATVLAATDGKITGLSVPFPSSASGTLTRLVGKWK